MIIHTPHLAAQNPTLILRTLSGLFGLTLVRSPDNFGHNLGFLALPCPKFTQLRTQSRLFGFPLSEVLTTSDTISAFWLSLVRSSLNFGHNLGFSAFRCPKFSLLRTQSRLFGSTLSEVSTTSDTIWLFGSPLSEVHSTSDTIPAFGLSTVRSSHYFGHNLGFSALPCPKFTQLRTQSGLFGSPLSEVLTTSDTISAFRLYLVRSLLNFGHNPVSLALHCPKFSLLRTQSSFLAPPQSEVHTTSDTIWLLHIVSCTSRYFPSL